VRTPRPLDEIARPGRTGGIGVARAEIVLDGFGDGVSRHGAGFYQAGRGDPACQGVRAELPAEDHIDSRKDGLEQGAGYLSGALREQGSIDGEICDTFATESLGRPVTRARRRAFPGASAQRRLLVKGTQTTVAI
jgi:hypothetical protein